LHVELNPGPGNRQKRDRKTRTKLYPHPREKRGSTVRKELFKMRLVITPSALVVVCSWFYHIFRFLYRNVFGMGLLTLSVNVFDFTKIFLRFEAQNQNHNLVYIPSIFYFQTETVRETSNEIGHEQRRIIKDVSIRGAFFLGKQNRISKQFVLRKYKRYRAVF